MSSSIKFLPVLFYFYQLYYILSSSIICCPVILNFYQFCFILTSYIIFFQFYYILPTKPKGSANTMLGPITGLDTSFQTSGACTHFPNFYLQCNEFARCFVFSQVLLYFYQLYYILSSSIICLPVLLYFYQLYNILSSSIIFCPVLLYFYQFCYIFTSYIICCPVILYFVQFY